MRSTSAVYAAATNSRIRTVQAARSASISGRVARGRSSSAPWLPMYAIVPIATICRAVASRRPLKLVAIGTLAGLFSGLFGVGGGAVLVPLLVLWLAYDERGATATSLAAIAVIAGFAALVQGLYGNVDAGDAALVGVPAIA